MTTGEIAIAIILSFVAIGILLVWLEDERAIVVPITVIAVAICSLWGAMYFFG